MEKWIQISILLCVFGFFREFRPSEPFVTEFLSGEWRNVTAEQVNREVYPFGTYSYLAQLIVVFLITDMLRYKPIILISACIGIVLWSLLLWTYTLELLKVVQVCYGTFMAAEVAYYTYIFAKVDRSQYQKVCGHTRSAILIGRFASSVVAQLLVSFQLMNFRDLNYLSLAAQIISLALAMFLPSVKSSVYFYSANPTVQTNPTIIISTVYGSRDETVVKDMKPLDTETKVSFSCSRAVTLLWHHFRVSYTNLIVIQWSIWWSLAMCGFLQVQSYVQILWKEIDDNRESQYNGAVEALLTLLGALGAFSAGFLNSKRFNQLDIWILTICSLFEGGLILWSALTDNVYVAYAMYILFGMLYHFMITVASATVAKQLLDDSFALVFGINTLLALIFQTILTVVVVSEDGLALDIRNQFIVSGGYYLVLGGLYFLVGIIKYVQNKRRRSIVE